MQQQNLLIALLLTLAPSILTLNCPSTVSLSSTCTFRLQDSDSDCSIFSFKSCTYQRCKQYGNYRGHTHCQEYETLESPDWRLCTEHCCDPAVTYTPSWNSLQQCQQYTTSTSGSLSPIIIATLCSTSVILISLILFIYCWCCSQRCRSAKAQLQVRCASLSACLNRFTCQFCLNLQNRPPRRNPSTNGSCEKIEDLTVEQVQLKKQWILPSLISQKLEDDCCICLQRGPSVVLQCGHAFHRQCVCQSMKFKRQCSMCRSQEFNNITIYCQRCYSSCFETTLLDHRLELGQSRQVCAGCQKEGEVSVGRSV